MIAAPSREIARKMAKKHGGTVVDTRHLNKPRPVLTLNGNSDTMVQPKQQYPNWSVAVSEVDHWLIKMQK